jgi:hypothetical protein
MRGYTKNSKRRSGRCGSPVRWSERWQTNGIEGETGVRWMKSVNDGSFTCRGHEGDVRDSLDNLAGDKRQKEELSPVNGSGGCVLHRGGRRSEDQAAK